jgi:hypothetical protein
MLQCARTGTGEPGLIEPGRIRFRPDAFKGQEIAMTPDTPSHRYRAHASGAGHARLVEATSFETAALAFTEDHAAQLLAGTTDGEIRVIVQSEDGGPEHCFVVHLGDGDIKACG